MFIVTAGTLHKRHFFNTDKRLNYLTRALLTLAAEYEWKLQAWAIFSNHYHFVAEAKRPLNLPRLIKYLHSITAKRVNFLDGATGRKVWFEYWDTRLTYEKTFLSRLNYVHTNPVKHGLVADPEAYPWCSAAWFARSAERTFHSTVMRFPSDRVNLQDEFQPVKPSGETCGVRKPGSRC